MPKIFPACLFVLAFTCSLHSAVSFAEPKPEPSESTEPDYTQYELTVFTAKPGKLAAVHDWLRAHADKVFTKHGVTNIAYFTSAGPNPDNKILAIHRYSSLPALLETSRAIKADPLWQPMDPDLNLPEYYWRARRPSGSNPQIIRRSLRPVSPKFPGCSSCAYTPARAPKSSPIFMTGFASTP